MTRSEFVKAYAERSGLSDRWADLGEIEVAGRSMIALPCGCGNECCEGWAMVTAGDVSSHLFFSAPDELRSAYQKALEDCGGSGP